MATKPKRAGKRKPRRRPPAAHGDRATRRKVAQLFRATRRELGYSQTALGKVFGKSRDTVSRIERGELSAPPKVLLYLGRLQKAESARRQMLRGIARDSRALKWAE